MSSDNNRDLNEVLQRYDDSTEKFAEHSVKDSVSKLQRIAEASEPSLALLAESIAFTEYPSIQKVTPEILDYWAQRAIAAKHPILKARYADLVWDFSKTVTGKAASVAMAQITIDNTIEIARNNCHKHPTAVIQKLKRAVILATRLNDTDRITRMRDAVLTYEDHVAEDDKRGLWGFVYDCLLLNKNVHLTEAQKAKIIRDLEARLERVSNPPEGGRADGWAAEAAAIRLAKHYRRLRLPEEVKRVLLKYGTAFEKMAANAPALAASFWLPEVHATYREYGLKEEADRLAVILRKLGPDVNAELQSFSHTTEIPREKMEQYVEAMITGELDDALTRVAIHYIPTKNEVEQLIRKLVKEAPLSFFVTQQLQDYKGRPVAVIGTLEEDLDGHIVSYMSQHIDFTSVFLRSVMEALVQKFDVSPQRLVDYLYQSPMFEECKKPIIEAGLIAYLNEDHLVAVHLLIPQIEDAIRNLVEKAGESVLKPARGGGFHLRTFDELLRDQCVIDTFNEDIVLYFRVLCTDPRGWNIRNNVCHGISPANEFDPRVGDRIVHVLLCLALIRVRE